MNLSASLQLSPRPSSFINPKGNWPGPSAHLHPSCPDNQHITVPTPKNISVAVGLDDKVQFLRVAGKKSLEGRILISSEITPNFENITFLVASNWFPSTEGKILYLHQKLS
jgi:hypothetical protein